MQIGLLNHSSRVSDGQVAAIAEAVNHQVIECAGRWSVPPTPVAFYSQDAELPAGIVRIMDIVDSIDVPGALGYHTNEFGVIYGRVLAAGDADGTAITVSHECLEMLIDPSCAGWRLMPDGFSVALEVCDPCQGDSYAVDVELFGIHYPVRLSNYVYPDWFNEEIGVAALDRMGRIVRPFEMSPGGYMIVRDQSGKQGNRFAQVRFGGDMGRRALASRLMNPDGRVQRRLVG